MLTKCRSPDPAIGFVSSRRMTAVCANGTPSFVWSRCETAVGDLAEHIALGGFPSFTAGGMLTTFIGDTTIGCIAIAADTSKVAPGFGRTLSCSP